MNSAIKHLYRALETRQAYAFQGFRIGCTRSCSQNKSYFPRLFLMYIYLYIYRNANMLGGRGGIGCDLWTTFVYLLDINQNVRGYWSSIRLVPIHRFVSLARYTGICATYRFFFVSRHLVRQT